MVGHVVIGVLLSSMKASSLSSQPLRSGLSSISYSLPKLSVFWKKLEVMDLESKPEILWRYRNVI